MVELTHTYTPTSIGNIDILYIYTYVQTYTHSYFYLIVYRKSLLRYSKDDLTPQYNNTTAAQSNKQVHFGGICRSNEHTICKHNASWGKWFSRLIAHFPAAVHLGPTSLYTMCQSYPSHIWPPSYKLTCYPLLFPPVSCITVPEGLAARSPDDSRWLGKTEAEENKKKQLLWLNLCVKTRH